LTIAEHRTALGLNMSKNTPAAARLRMSKNK
jgi:hypothetical protein